MRREGLLFVVLVLALSTAGAQQTCKVRYAEYEAEVPCGSGGSVPTEPAADEPWYQSLDIWLGIIGLAASGGAGAFAVYRVRTKRRALTVSLAAIEAAYADAKADPETGIARLSALRAEVREAHQKGRLDDVHFLELDRRVTQYLVKLRLLEIDRRFAGLPPLLLAEIRRLLSDGVLSQSEADLIEVRAAAYRIHETTRNDLIGLTRRWANDDGSQDGPVAAAHALP